MHVILEYVGVWFIGPVGDKKDTHLETSSLLSAFTVPDYDIYATMIK